MPELAPVIQARPSAGVARYGMGGLFIMIFALAKAFWRKLNF
jgi:hypothetical protein